MMNQVNPGIDFGDGTLNENITQDLSRDEVINAVKKIRTW